MSGAGIMEPDHVKGKMKKAKEVVSEDLRIPARPAEAGDPALPKSVVDARKLATTAGWSCELIYARGITSTPKLVHIYALRMTRDGKQVSATWYADAIEGKLTWKFNYAGTIGGWLTTRKEDGAVIVKPFPFTLSSDEMKGLLKAEPMKRVLLMDSQYDSITNEDKSKYFISEAEFRAPYKRVPKPKKKTQEELIADDEMDMVLG